MAADSYEDGERRGNTPGALPFLSEPIRRRLAAFSDALDRAVMLFCIACLVVMLGISVVGALYMAVTGDALSWTYSLARLFIPWLALLSITIAYKAGEHIAMATLYHSVPSPVRKVLYIANLAVAVLFAVLLVWYGWGYAMGSRQLYMVSDQIQIHARWIAAAVPVSGLILVIHMLCGRLVIVPPNASPVPDLDDEPAGGPA